MATANELKPVFAAGSDSPADLLINAAAVTRFLADVAESFHSDGPGAGLSESGCFGLLCVLDGIENTINLAVDQL